VAGNVVGGMEAGDGYLVEPIAGGILKDG